MSAASGIIPEITRNYSHSRVSRVEYVGGMQSTNGRKRCHTYGLVCDASVLTLSSKSDVFIIDKVSVARIGADSSYAI